MAKTGLWLRGAIGQLAGVTMQKGANGETIMREKVTPKNPQTMGQLIQRIIMATVMLAYSFMKELCDHSFEGVTAGAQSMSKFLQYNANAIRQKLTTEVEHGYDLGSVWAFSPLGSKVLAPNEYFISMGTLPGITPVLPSGQSTMAQIAGLAENSYQAVIDKYGLRRGDQLTFVTLQGSTPERSQFYFSRVILDPTNADGTQASLSVPLVGANNKVNLPSPRNTGEFLTLTYQNGAVNYSYSAQMLTASGIIVSRKEGDTWLRSTCQLVTDPERTSYGYYSMQQCLDMVNQGGVSLLSGRYLNNAGQGAVANAEVEGIVATLLNGTTVTVVGVSFDENGYAKLNDSEGHGYFLKGNCVRATSYGKYVKADSSTATAPEGATDANTIGVEPTFLTEEGTFTANINWLVNHGVSANAVLF